MGDLDPDQDHSSWWVLLVAVVAPILIVIGFLLAVVLPVRWTVGWGLFLVVQCLSGSGVVGRGSFGAYAKETGAKRSGELLWRPRYIAFHARRLGFHPKWPVRLVVTLWLLIPFVCVLLGDRIVAPYP